MDVDSSVSAAPRMKGYDPGVFHNHLPLGMASKESLREEAEQG